MPLSTDKRQKIVIQKSEELSSTVITASVDRKYGFQKHGFGSEINDDYSSSYFFDSISHINFLTFIMFVYFTHIFYLFFLQECLQMFLFLSVEIGYCSQLTNPTPF